MIQSAKENWFIKNVWNIFVLNDGAPHNTFASRQMKQ